MTFDATYVSLAIHNDFWPNGELLTAAKVGATTNGERHMDTWITDTSRIPDGATTSIDGSTGTVTVLSL